MNVLVDISVWIDYFRGGEGSDKLDLLIDENLLVTNDIILAELIPFLKVRNQTEVITLLQKIKRVPLQIDWGEIIEFQVKCLQNGANGIGIPDLIIAQNAKLNNCEIYALDKHFKLLNQVIDLKLFQ
ncbi:MAG: PIN domain nuclease [Anaerolineaceae bacterium]|nr:PIN domain nuclease [Anaerolineaceae bacterium]